MKFALLPHDGRRVAACALAVLALFGCGEAERSHSDSDRARVEIGSRVEGRSIVITDDRRASEVGAQVLLAGGNAVDAAVAAAFALAVVRPEAGNLGGGGFMLVHMREASDDGAETVFIDCRETAPGASSRTMFLDDDGEFDAERSLWSGLASGVPGTVAGLEHAHQRFGRTAWRELVQPAIDLAAHGFVVSARLDTLLRRHEERLSRSAETARIFLGPHRARPRQEPWVQTDLARTLELLQEHGARAFYEGPIAARMVEEVARWGGIMTLDDLASYRVVERAPVRGYYRGLEVVSAPPPSSGGALVLLLLRLTELMQLGATPPEDPATVHRLVEIMRRAYALRSAEFGDPDHVAVDLEWMGSAAVAEELVREISPTATPSDALHLPGGRTPERALDTGSHDTTHLLVVDEAGNVVSFTTTLNASFGNGLVVRGAGFLLNNEMDDFTGKPGAPNLYGLVQGEKNAVAPGKRPLSSMSPTLVLEDGVPVMALGSPGGARIINAVFQVIAHQVEFGMDPEAAVRFARVHHQYLPDWIDHEAGRLPPATVVELERRGHRVADEPRSIGHVHLIVRHGVDRWIGVVDQRRGGAAATWTR